MAATQFVLACLESVDATFITMTFLASVHLALSVSTKAALTNASPRAQVGVTYGSYWTLNPALIGDIFGNGANFARTYSIFGLAPTAGSLLFSTLMASRIYKAHKSSSGADECVGTGCFRDTFLVLGGMLTLSAAVALWVSRRTRAVYE